MGNNGQSTFRDICRTCMKQIPKIQNDNVTVNNRHCIYDVPTGCQSNTSIAEILQLLVPSINIDVRDNLPNTLCSECITILLKAYDFLETYKEVDKKFRKMLKEFDTINSNDYLQLIEEKNHSVEVLDDIDENSDIDEITKVEFEVEEAKNNKFAVVENENEIDWSELGDETLNEMSELSIKTGPCLNNIYNSNNKLCHPIKICKRRGRKRKIDIKTLVTDSHNTPVTKSVLKSQYGIDRKMGLPPQNEDGSISCRECDAVLENVINWQQHMRQHRLGKIPKIKYKRESKVPKTSTPSKKKYECEYCGKAFRRNAEYKNHLRIHTGEEPYLCIECGKSFKVVSSLNTHMLRHKGEKTYQCAHCPKKFVCSSGLYGHMMVHTKEKPYVCDICGSAFHMAYQLRKHNLYHTGTKKFQCEYCDMRFVTSEKQRRHMRTHTGEKPYRCKYCERAFAQSNDCIKHLRQHLGDNVYQCELCPLRFPMARDMKVHFATHKDDDEETRALNLQARLEEERSLQIKLGVQDS